MDPPETWTGTASTDRLDRRYAANGVFPMAFADQRRLRARVIANALATVRIEGLEGQSAPKGEKCTLRPTGAPSCAQVLSARAHFMQCWSRYRNTSSIQMEAPR